MAKSKAVQKIRMNSGGALAVLNDPKVASDMLRRANAIANAAPKTDGEEWLVSSFTTDRPNATVRTGNKAARLASAENNALMRALDAGR
ncbi:hypothetical protein SEA_EDEN_9 [Microbacterium phage Eden]|uniref:Uncharacterized protein n=1 Tax=Microbacterium phage Eden TaxID=2250289 RepID=A0A345KWA2_9CAUD|nr:hypothetical protein HOT71_gp09 [Microbacterium phage Eden]AXH47304.1 hypothetical protein SEA_EDEN_9 [Microbacterium phage Eden]